MSRLLRFGDFKSRNHPIEITKSEFNLCILRPFMSNVSSEYNFTPRRRLRGAHLQTIAGNFLPRTNLLPPGERRRFIVAEHGSGAKVAVECLCHWQADRRPAMTVVVVH